MAALLRRLSVFAQSRPLVHRLATLAENAVKKPLFGCQDCGECILSYTAFTCAMRCPKQMRNGPCGGTREKGRCEVYPERMCRWVLIHRRARRLGRLRKLYRFQTAHNWTCNHTSAWLNVLSEKIDPPSWGRD